MKRFYLKAYESISHAKKELARFFDRYNTRRPNQGLNDKTPDEVYYETLPEIKEAVSGANHLKNAGSCRKRIDKLSVLLSSIETKLD